MNLADVELQQLTSHPIVKGRLWIGSEAGVDAFIPNHDRVLLGIISGDLTIWPVTNIARDGDGFCETALGEFGLCFFGFGIHNLGIEAGSPFVRGGTSIGCLLRCEVREDTCTPLRSISNYKLKTEYCSEGLHFGISGKFEAADDSRSSQDDPMLNSDAFSLDATIPWATLVLKDYPGAHWAPRMGHITASPSKEDSLDRPRDPRRLGDLLIDRTRFTPLIKGRILLSPESALPPRKDRYDAQALTINFDRESIWFHDAPRVETLGNGFAVTSPFIRYVDIELFGWTTLERAFAQSNSLSMTVAGDDLGSVGYAIDETERVRPGYTVNQQIKSMSIRAVLAHTGLEITAEGELANLDAAKNRRNRGNPNFPKLQSNPIRAFALEATVPWALLAAKGIRIADRVRYF